MAERIIADNEALLKIVESATSTLELDDLLNSMLTTLKEVTGADSASILLQEDEEIVVKACLGISIEEEVKAGYALKPGEGLAGTIFRTRKPLYLKDITADPLVINPFLKSSGARSFLGVPIRHKDETIGVLHIDWREIHAYTKRELNLLTIVADRCGAAIANARQHAKLKDAEAKFRHLFENVPGSVGIAKVIRDPQGGIIDWKVSDMNRMAEKLTGISRDAATGKRATEIWGPEAMDEAIRISNEVMALGRPVRYESARWRGIHLMVSIFPMVEDQLAWVGIDVTELKRKETELAETSSYLENLLDYANAPIIVWDSNLRVTKFNHAFEHLTGYAAQDVLGKRLEMLFPEEYREPSMALIHRTSTGEHWESVEIPIRCVNGTVRMVLWNSATIYRSGTNRVAAIIAQGQDITERKEAEMALAETSSYLENLIDYANAPIIVWNPDFKIIRFNHAFEHLTGREASEVLGERLDILFPAVSVQDSMAMIRRTSTGEHWESVEIPIQRVDGRIRTVLWNSATIYVPGTNKVFATIAQGQDITDRKDVERELVRSNAELEQFAYVASHDLKEPLRMISGFLELLSVRYEGKIDSEADEFIRFAIDGAKRMNWLIEDLLQFSRIGRTAWKPELASIEDAYQEAIRNLAVPIRDSGANITRGALPTLVIDRIQLTTLLQNLIGNAIKFHSDAPPRIEVQAKNEDGMWVFSVKDNGIGFPQEYSEKIFMMFERLHSKERYPGTGIGLAICKKIVERHGGRIWAESRGGQGSTFYFSIPETSANLAPGPRNPTVE